MVGSSVRLHKFIYILDSTNKQTLQPLAYPLSSGSLESPAQTVINFPQTNGRFSRRYYDTHQWIEYSEADDGVYCFPCRHLFEICITLRWNVRKSHIYRKRIQESRHFWKLLVFWGRQGLAFRGHDESEDSINKGNFLELLEMLCDEEPHLKAKISRRYGHYTSPEYQNDLISVFSSRIIRSIVAKVKESGFYSLMAHETKDISKQEQLAILIR